MRTSMFNKQENKYWSVRMPWIQNTPSIFLTAPTITWESSQQLQKKAIFGVADLSVTSAHKKVCRKFYYDRLPTTLCGAPVGSSSLNLLLQGIL